MVEQQAEAMLARKFSAWATAFKNDGGGVHGRAVRVFAAALALTPKSTRAAAAYDPFGGAGEATPGFARGVVGGKDLVFGKEHAEYAK